MRSLVIVESPTKARTIGRFLGKDYEIKFSMGHVMDLPKSKLGVDVENGFAPEYEIINDKKKIIAELKKSAKAADSIILATDPDREGEAIASHVADMLGESQKSKVKSQKYQRIVFHEITKEAIEEALKNPRLIDLHLVGAQTARRVLDRLVGYKLSPLLWRKVRRGLSAGRVQSVALRLIVEREREIEKFKKEDYWTISVLLARGPVRSFPPASAPLVSLRAERVRAVGSLSTSATPRSDSPVDFDLIEINGEKIEIQKNFGLYDGEYKVTKTTIEEELEAKKIVDDLKTKQYIVSDVIQKEMRRSPQPPYTTSTLQQDASRRLGLNGKRTMSLAQKLYEEGYITYHRTDSVAVALSAQKAIINFIKKEYGDRYVPSMPRFYKTKQKLAQEAHEAIRPTRTDGISNFKNSREAGSGFARQILNIVGEQGWRLYELIWRRAVASQMSDAIIESTTVLVDSQIQNSKFKIQNEGNIYRLKSTGSVLVFDGFLKVNPLGLQDNRLPRFEVSEKLTPSSISQQFHETASPPRYNDASLIKTLEEKGIGRPSTYATIVSTIESRLYIERDQGRFIPTSVGTAVNDFLVTNFSDIDDIPFTAEMEDQLDNIANGETEWQPMIKEFYEPFEKKLEEVEGAERVKIAVEQTDEKCPECKEGNLVVRTGRFGKFLSCGRFPKCKFSKAFTEETGLNCPKCGSPTFAKASAGKGGEIVIKKTRKGRRFYGCSNYPACTFAAWKLEDVKKEMSVKEV